MLYPLPLLLLPAGFTEPHPPDVPHTQHRRAAIIPLLRAVRVAQDHREDPEKGTDPCYEQDGDGEDGREEEDEEEEGSRVVFCRAVAVVIGVVVERRRGGVRR